MKNASSTIYALASAPGKAGVCVVRISGPQAREAVTFLSSNPLPAPRMATLLTLKHEHNLIDRALVLWFPAPHSFTGEDVLELHLHGGRAVQRQLFDALSAMGLRLAEPGEFSRRAFLNNKMDLLEAEGLADLIDADTQAQAAQALRQMSGEASARVAALREAVIAPLALLEAYIDFPDEEIPESVLAETKGQIDGLVAEIKHLLADGGIGEKIRAGFEVVIIGPPNAGKSSLINLLAKRDIAIVSDEPGTTRDAIEAHIQLAGHEITLVDTAGLREAKGAIEAEGIKRTQKRASEADFALCMVSAENAQAEWEAMRPLLTVNTLIYINKSDIAAAQQISQATEISVKTGKNIDLLLRQLADKLESYLGSVPSPLITRARHREALTEALKALESFSSEQPLELACEELRQAANAIGKISGQIRVDDVLDLVFSRFCIGK